MVDHDLLFVFSPNLSPSYRWLLNLVNHFAIWLSLVAIVYLPSLLTNLCKASSRAIWLIYIGIIIFVGCHVAFHLPTGNRGKVWTAADRPDWPSFVIGVRQLGTMRRSIAILLFGAVCLSSYVGYIISEWERSQAPVIVRHRENISGIECGGFQQYVRDIHRAIFRTAPGLGPDFFLHSLAEHVMLMAIRNTDEKPYAFSSIMPVDGRAVYEYARRRWGDISIRLIGNTHGAISDASLLIIPFPYSGGRWPERYPCIDGRRTLTDLPNEIESREQMKAALAAGWRKWTTVEGPYFQAEIFYKSR